MKNNSYKKYHYLFLDRDGVINKRLPGRYVSEWEEFEFLPGVTEAIKYFNTYFKKIFIVTNQQGIAKGILPEENLIALHQQMKTTIESSGGRLDAIYYSPDLANTHSPTRKPATGMGLWAKRDFPEVIFEQSIMVGDSISDLEFGRALGMKTIWITGKENTQPEQNLYDESYSGLLEWRGKLED